MSHYINATIPYNRVDFHYDTRESLRLTIYNITLYHRIGSLFIVQYKNVKI